jgi:cytoskeletal protein CcmA (bactofilin family)
VSGSTGLSLGGAGQPERSPAEAETPANQDIAAPSSASGVAVDLSSPASTLKSFVIPRGYRVSGVIISHRPVVLRGELHGRSVSAGAVTVEATGVLRAPAEVESLRVFGSVVAPVRATLAVEVMSGGSIQDDLETPCLHVAAGGRVSGGLLTVGAAR